MTSGEPRQLTRRRFISTSATLLATLELGGLLSPKQGLAAQGTADLAANRPVSVSSTDYAPTPATFAVDDLAEVGVRGSGWRAKDGDPQWIAVDLQAPCSVESVVLVFEAKDGDPAFEPKPGDNPRAGTTGQEILSSFAVEFRIEASSDGRAWQTVHSTSAGTGGVTKIQLDAPVRARWLRMTATRRSNANPLGLNGLQVYGTCDRDRPAATGWTSWGKHHGSAPSLAVAADGTVPLESGWTLTLDDWAPEDDGAALSRAGVDTSAWLPATVPGTVLASLVEQGHLPDPVYGFNNLHVPEALSRHAWWYRREFRLPHGLNVRPGRHVWLELDGVNHQAEVWVNGRRAGDVSHPFARASYDVTGSLRARGAQAVAVKVTPMPFPGSPGDKGPDGVAYHDGGSDTMMRNGPTYLSVSGWDWMPAVRDRATGIWNHVRLRSTGHAVLGDPQVTTTLPGLPDTSTAEVTIAVPVRNASAAAQRVTVRAAFGKVVVSQTVTAPGSGTAVARFTPADFPSLKLDDPQLWWPNGYGDPALQELTLTASIGGEESDRRSTRFGIRQFDYTYDVPQLKPQVVDFPVQQARYVEILGHKRATSWGISLFTVSVYDSSDPATDLALHKTATASSSDDPSRSADKAVDGDSDTRWSSAYQDEQWIRVDLGQTSTIDRVALDWETAFALEFSIRTSVDGTNWTDAKDVSNRPTPLQISVNGVRVFCRGGNWGFDELLRRMPASRMDAVLDMHRDMNFTMIRNWVGSSDREEFFAGCDERGLLVWNDFWNAWFLDPPDHRLYLDIARDTIRRYRTHPSLVVWCGANEGTPSQEIDDGVRQAVADEHPGVLYQANSASGIVSGGGPYWYTDPKNYFSTGSFGFHTEIGIPTVPVAESMQSLLAGEDGWPIGNAWYFHDWCLKGNQQPASYKAAIDDRLGESGGLDEFCRKAQFVNYENTRAMFEAWNANLWGDASGLLLWMSHPAWHSTVWQTYDYDLDVNGTYYGARKGCEPLHVQASATDWTVHALNHSAHRITGATVTAELLDLRGHRLAAPRSQGVDLPPSSSAQAFTVDWPGSLPSLHILRLSLRDAGGEELAENVYWRYKSAQDMRQLNALPRAQVSVSTHPVARDQGRQGAIATVRNDGSVMAAMVRLAVRNKRTGDRVLPARYDDNYFWLRPGERRQIAIDWPADALDAGTWNVTAEAYNR